MRACMHACLGARKRVVRGFVISPTHFSRTFRDHGNIVLSLAYDSPCLCVTFRAPPGTYVRTRTQETQRNTVVESRWYQSPFAFKIAGGCCVPVKRQISPAAGSPFRPLASRVAPPENPPLVTIVKIERICPHLRYFLGYALSRSVDPSRRTRYHCFTGAVECVEVCVYRGHCRVRYAAACGVLSMRNVVCHPRPDDHVVRSALLRRTFPFPPSLSLARLFISLLSSLLVPRSRGIPFVLQPLLFRLFFSLAIFFLYLCILQIAASACHVYLDEISKIIHCIVFLSWSLSHSLSPSSSSSLFFPLIISPLSPFSFFYISYLLCSKHICMQCDY